MEEKFFRLSSAVAPTAIDMKYDPFKHHRRSIRLPGYAYSQAGADYVTIVTQNRLCLFGEVMNGEMCLNDAGRRVLREWEVLPQRFPNIELDEFGVMPNHVHGIIAIAGKMDDMGDVEGGHKTRPYENQTRVDGVGATLVVAQPNAEDDHDPALGEIIGAWKSIVTDEYIRGVRDLDWEPFCSKLWQHNYYEHIIRNEKDLDRIRAYIINNPANWNQDEENPNNQKPAHENRTRR